MVKNTPSRIYVYVWDTATGAPNNLALGNLSASYSLRGDADSASPIQDTGGSQIDGTLSPGWYSYALTADETNSDFPLYVAKCSISGTSCRVENPAPTMLPAPNEGSGEFPIDHNGGSGAAGAQCTFYLPYTNPAGVHSSTDVMRLTSNGSVGAPSLAIRAYLASDYDAGNRTVIGLATTNSDGRWAGPINLNSGTYYLVADNPSDGFQAYQIKVVIP